MDTLAGIALAERAWTVAGQFQQRGCAVEVMRPVRRFMGQARVVWGLHADGRMFPMHASISCGVDGDRRYYTSIIRELVDAPVLDEDTFAAR